jgi:hypothetical protein
VQRFLTLAILLVTFATAGVAAAGVAMAAESGFDLSSLLVPSASAGLLPPITIEGRKGWDCTAERNATSKSLADSALPNAR